MQFPQLHRMVALARQSTSTAIGNEQFCISKQREYVFVMTICAAVLFSPNAEAAPLNLLRLNPNTLAVSAGMTNTVTSTTEDPSAMPGLAECGTPGDYSRHIRLLIRVMERQWGFGIVMWLSEEDFAAMAASCDYFGRGVWPFADPHAGATGGAFGAGSFGAVGGSGLATRTSEASLFIDRSFQDTNDYFDDEGPADDSGFEPAGNPFGAVSAFSMIDEPLSDGAFGDDGAEDSDATDAGTPDFVNTRLVTNADQPTPVPEPGSWLLLATGLSVAWRKAREV